MTGPTDFRRELYPFLYGTERNGPSARAAALADVRASTLQKCRDVVDLRGRLIDAYADVLVDAAVVSARAFSGGGKLLAFGNGGSATDAQDAVADCMAPPFPGWRALPAIALTNDVGVVTAVANDVGFENVFARQIIALGEPGDIALAITTSGNSPSILAGLREAQARGLHTIALTGYDGGELARQDLADHAFTARLEYVPRIQEGHATLWHTLLDLVQSILSGTPDDRVPGGLAAPGGGRS